MHLVAFLQYGLPVRREDIAAAHQSRDNDAARNQVRDIFQHDSEEILVIDSEAARFDFLGARRDICGVILGGLVWVLPEDDAHEEHHEDDADDAEGVGNGVPDARKGGVHPSRGKCGVRGSEGGRVRDGAAEHADEYRHIAVHVGKEVQAERYHHAEEHDACREHVEHEAVPADGIHESRAHLHADGVHEKYQAEFLDKVQHVAVDAQADVPEADAHEKCACTPEAYSLDLDLAEHEPESRGKRDGDDLLRDGGFCE